MASQEAARQPYPDQPSTRTCTVVLAPEVCNRRLTILHFQCVS